MKKKMSSLLLLVLCLCILTACASNRSASTPVLSESVNRAESENRGGSSGQGTSSYTGVGYLQAEIQDLEGNYSSSSDVNLNNPDELFDDNTSNDYSSKIIYTAIADVETIDFDEAITLVYELLRRNNGFIESSYVSGKDYSQSYYGYQTYRRAEFELRIPRDRFFQVTSNLSDLGNVTSLRTSADNITMLFFDSESRLSSLRIQEERLLSMLERAENVAEMLDIETSLMQVRYNIESLTSTLQNWQSQVDYSTLTIYLREVQTLTVTEPVEERSYWEEIKEGFTNTIDGLERFFLALFKWVAIYSPVIAILIVILIIVILVSKKASKKRTAEKNDQLKTIDDIPPKRDANQNDE
ncbi:MAG: DUF4349 domain-containing protein [Oscillospiraceae bacterium]|nr:DUF4349 domain-containing protein [Oscillospiraceae bacterium]